MLTLDAGDFPLSDMSGNLSEEDLVFEKSMIETRATTVSQMLRLLTQNGSVRFGWEFHSRCKRLSSIRCDQTWKWGSPCSREIYNLNAQNYRIRLSRLLTQNGSVRFWWEFHSRCRRLSSIRRDQNCKWGKLRFREIDHGNAPTSVRPDRLLWCTNWIP